ncbi:hypothetical protein KXX32_009344 [Aspergillus fumigatus]|nr:hypothetical protein KXX32_009344 [Aspergillus fumigatus]
MVGDNIPKLAVLIDADNARSSVQFAYTHGKNATDSAMIIDAMDLCTLAGLTVYGFGEHKTPRPFVAACDKFIYTENLVHIDEFVPHAGSVSAGENHPSALQTQNDSDLATLLRMTVEAVSDDDGWARLSKVGLLLTKRYPDFDPRTYGYHKLSDLTNASSFLETARRSLGKGLSAEIFVRDKRRKP